MTTEQFFKTYPTAPEVLKIDGVLYLSVPELNAQTVAIAKRRGLVVEVIVNPNLGGSRQLTGDSKQADENTEGSENRKSKIINPKS